MMRVTAIASGWVGGPALNTFYFGTVPDSTEGAQAGVEGVRAFWASLNTFFPPSVVWQVQGTVDAVTPESGQVVNTFNVTPPASVPGIAASSSLGPPSVALLLQLRTNTFIAGRRVLGRSFISPLAFTQMEGDGTPMPGAISGLSAAGEALRVSGGLFGELGVWHRPTAGVGGQFAPCTGVSVPNKFASLRSRRD